MKYSIPIFQTLKADIYEKNYTYIESEVFEEMLMARKRIFIDHKKWNMDSYVGGYKEMDMYDDKDAYYIYYWKNSLIGSVRLRKSSSPTLLSGPFKYLKDMVKNNNIYDDNMWEASRFFIVKEGYSDDVKKIHGLSHYTLSLFIGMIIFGVKNNVSYFEVVVDVLMARVLKRAGWELTVLSESYGSNNDIIYYGILDCNDAILDDIIKKFNNLGCNQ
ncbi:MULTISPECIES: acyl-homoserine-lactone synthase [Vreelandella]|uniref:Acyl-homoserine-lactone synthase n=2 Tax=Vreelandella TaxID=3137766 RepID=A0AAU7XI99_9GAMM|nr:hypothetical protein [Halomonas neptunia]